MPPSTSIQQGMSENGCNWFEDTDLLRTATVAKVDVEGSNPFSRSNPPQQETVQERVLVARWLSGGCPVLRSGFSAGRGLETSGGRAGWSTICLACAAVAERVDAAFVRNERPLVRNSKSPRRPGALS